MLESCDIVPNVDDITCPICLDIYGPAEAVVLQDCLHSFCWTCLQNTIQHSDTPDVSCPFISEDNSTCDSQLRQREIKAVNLFLYRIILLIINYYLFIYLYIFLF